MNYNEEDFRFSAQLAIAEFFKNFTYPDKSIFDQEQLNHIEDIATSILMTKHNFRTGGGFAQAIVANNLSQAYNRGDSTMIKAMPIMNYVCHMAGMIKCVPGFETIITFDL